MIALAGAATGAGALPLLFIKSIPRRIVDAMLGFAAGVMLSAASFSLMVPAFEGGRVLVPILGLFAGAGLLAAADFVVPHLHPGVNERGRSLGNGKGNSGEDRNLNRGGRRAVWLALVAVALDNVPEGLSVGISFASGDHYRAVLLAGAIAVQNMPEGLAATLPLIDSGTPRARAVLYTFLAGLTEPLAALAGLSLVSRAAGLLPFALAFAAGCMVYAAADEMLPEAFSHGHLREVVGGLIAGYAFMAMVEQLL